MMDKSVAEHLNALNRRAADPVKLIATHWVDGTPVAWKLHATDRAERAAVSRLIGELRAQYAPLAIDEEIRNAARERRDADTYLGEGQADDAGLLYWAQVNGAHARAGGICLRLAMPAIQADIDARNQSACAIYESYRLACEQGVAVAPAPAPQPKTAEDELPF